MDLFVSETLSRDALLKEAFARRGKSLPDVFSKTPNGKPFLPDIFFSITHTEGFVAVAMGKSAVGLDAERRRERKVSSYLRRLTEREKDEDFFELWTAKEAYVKYIGGTLAKVLFRLEYAKHTLFLEGTPAPVFLQHFDMKGVTLCLCTEQETDVSVFLL